WSDQPLFRVSAGKPDAALSISHDPALFSSPRTRTGMQFDWRSIFGPALTAATALIVVMIDRTPLTLPNAAPLFVCIVAVAGSLSGLASGLVSAAMAVGFAALLFLNHRVLPGYAQADIIHLLMLAVTAAGTAGITGLLRKRLMDTL